MVTDVRPEQSRKADLPIPKIYMMSILPAEAVPAADGPTARTGLATVSDSSGLPDGKEKTIWL